MSLLHFKINNGILTWNEERASGSRGESIINLTVNAIKNMNIPKNINLEWSVHAGDCPLACDNIPQPPHVFSVSEFIDNIDQAYPCWFFQGVPEINCPNYEELIDTLSINGDIKPIYNKIFWIGAPSSVKNKLYDIGQKNSEWMDIRLSRDVSVHFSEYTKWKYLIDVEGCAFGGGYSARIKALMFTKRILFIQDRQSWDMVRNILKDGINCIFIKNDMSDLEEKYKWIETQGEEFQKQMAQRLYDDAMLYCRRINAHNRICKLLTNLIEFNSTQ